MFDRLSLAIRSLGEAILWWHSGTFAHQEPYEHGCLGDCNKCDRAYAARSDV